MHQTISSEERSGEMEAKEEKRWTGVIAFAVILAAWLVLAVSSSAQMVKPQVAAGNWHTVGLKSDGTVVAWEQIFNFPLTWTAGATLFRWPQRLGTSSE